MTQLSNIEEKPLYIIYSDLAMTQQQNYVVRPLYKKKNLFLASHHVLNWVEAYNMLYIEPTHIQKSQFWIGGPN
jgi:hypothetical protein